MEIIFESGTDARLASGFTQVPNSVWRSPNLGLHAKCVYICLLSYAWEGPKCRPSYERIQSDLKVSQPTVTKALKELRAEGLVDWKRRGPGKTSLYVIKDLRTKGGLVQGKNQTLFGEEPSEVGSRTKGGLVAYSEVKEDPLEKDAVENTALALFGEFWSHYPRKEDKPDARRVFNGEGKLKDGTKMSDLDRTKALAAVKVYGEIWSRASKDRLQYRKLPAGWLRLRRFEDDPTNWEHTAGVTTSRQPVSPAFQTEDEYSGGRS